MKPSRKSDPARTDEDLVRDCLAGNQVAWNSLIEKYQRLVYSIPFRYGLPPEDAADVFQGVWADLFRELGGIQQVAALRGWLCTATARRCLLQKKRRQRVMNGGSLEADLPDLSPDPSEVLRVAEREERIRQAVAQLPERCQGLVRKLFFELPPRPYEQIARELGLAEGSIGFIRGRCLAKLKKILVSMDL